MPVRMSSSNGGAGRKVRVALGNSKGSGDVVKTLMRNSSNVDRAHRKARVPTGESRDGVRNGKQNMKSIGNGNAAAVVSYDDVNEISGEKRGRRKGDFRTKGALEAVIERNSGQKRKRTYAKPGIVEGTMVDDFHNRSSSKSRNHVVRLYSDECKNASRGKNHELENASRNAALTGFGKSKRNELFDNKIRRGNALGADELKLIQKTGLGNGGLKTSSIKKKTQSATEKVLVQRTCPVVSIEKPHKKNNYVKKSFGSESDLTEAPLPMKKKRVIRIDPRDVSNKRLDDSIANNGNSPAKMDSAESINVEMSKNAQFRAIQPSSSILSFVEDNLLGRRRDIEFRRAGYNTALSAPLDNIPFSTDSERERIEVPVFRNKLEFFASAKVSSSFPSPDLPEIAFAGRSNVGKSSLLNALTRQWGVVRTSDKPGLTQTINFFKLGPKLSLVDLPGYGFAYAKEEVKEAWEELVKEYVTTRVGLKRVCVLVDTKWGMKPRDLELIDLMERSQTKYQIVLTKTDLVFPIDVARRAMQIEENLKAKKSVVQPLMMVSSKTGAGIRSLRTILANIARLVRC